MKAAEIQPLYKTVSTSAAQNWCHVYTSNIYSIWVPIAKCAVHHTLGLVLLLPIVGKKEILPPPGHRNPAMRGSVPEEGAGVFVVSTKATPNVH